VLNTDFLDVLVAAREGESLPQLSFVPRATVCKYAVPAGYPTDPESGARVTVDEETIERVNARYRGDPDESGAVVDGGSAAEALLFYASVDERDDGIYTTTSRAFAVVGVAETIPVAEEVAEDALEAAGDGVRIRHDIGKPDLVQRRIDHVAELRGE
jgi:phosphoribosylamine--glycine ligase